MTGKIKRRSLRCGGRPKADFGSIFTTFIAPALGVAGSVADSAIAKHQANKVATTPAATTPAPEPKTNPEPKVDVTGNNGTTSLPPDPTKTPTMRLGGRKKCWIGAAIGAATSIAGSLFGAAAQKREMRRQKSIQDWQNITQEAAAMSTALNNSQDYQEDYLRQFRTAARLGKRLGAKGIYITDGGDATKIDNNTYLLRGGSHEDVNETGQTGIGINVGGNEVEAEGGEVAQKKNGALRIFSAQPILGNGMSPAQAILRGYNKDAVFSQQQAFKKRNGLKDDGSKAKHGTEVPYKRIHINEDGTFTDTLTGKNYNTSATNGEDVVITGKANHWKEAGKKNTSSYFDPIGVVNFATAVGAPILNANPSNIIGSIRDSKNAGDFLKHYMMQDTGGFVNTEWAKEHPYLSLGINTIGDIGLGIGTNKAVDILRHPLEYGKYGYKLNKLYKKAGLLNRGEYKTSQENYEKLLDYYTGNKPYDAGAMDYTYDIKAKNNAERVNPDMFYSYVTPQKGERELFKRTFDKLAPKYHGQFVNIGNDVFTPYYGYNWGAEGKLTTKELEKAYYDLMNHNPEYYTFLKETNLPWNKQSTVDEFLKRQQTSLRGVYADNKETAKDYLTTIQSKRVGGDRLNTHGGLYTSNSTGIANAFKNPNNGISNGYIGKLVYDFDIDKTKSIADQLRQARMKIVRGGNNNVFAGTTYYPKSITEARKQGAVAVEDNYGRSNGDVLNVTERAYFPGSAKQNKLTLQNLEEYLAQENQRGRWNTSGVDKMKGDEELFIPRQYNRFDDFIREARLFMKPRREYDYNKEITFMKELNNRMTSRSKYRNSLIDMSRGLRRRNERRSYAFNINGRIPLFDPDEPFRYGGRIQFRNGGLTSKDRGSSKHLYPSVSSKDFAGGGRSYPIPTKADAVDALRLAGLHGRSDVKAKVYSRYPELRKKAEIGTWIKPVYNTSKYRGTSRARTQIAKWEGSDFAGQNAQFKGDAIGAKERELRQFMGKAYNYLNDNQRDALLSYYYNLVPKTFRGQMTKYRNALINAQTEQEYNDTLNNMRESINVGANRKGMRGLRNRRATERNWFGYNYANPIQEKVDKTLTQVPDATKVVQPIMQQSVITKPIEINSQEGYVPNDNPQGYNIPQGRLYDFIKSNMKRQLRYGGYSRPIKGVRPKAELGWLGYPYPLPRKWDFTNINLGNYKPSMLSKNYPYARGMDDEARRLESSDNYRDFSLYRTQLDESNPYVQALTKATGHSWNDIKADNYKLRYDSKLGYNHFTPEVKEDKYGIWGEPIEQKTWLDNNKIDVKVPYAPQESIDIKKTIPVDTKKTTEYDIRDNKFGMTPSVGDWIGLGVDTLTGLAGGIINYNAANDMYIPGRAPIMLASKLPTNYNITPQVEEVKRMRDRLSGETYRNTSSSVAALNRAGNINLNALNELSKLWATKENEENKMLTQDALNQQSVAETNVRNQMARESEIAQYKNAQNQAKYDAINTSLTGLAQAYNNFYTNATKRYEDEIAMRTYLAGSEAATPYRMLSMGVPMSTRSRIGLLNQVGSITNPGPRPERKDYDSNASWSRAIDKWEKDNTLYKQRGQYKNMILRGISSKAKRKYGIG